MKTVRLLEYSGQLVFNEVPAPAIARDEILVKIKSTAVNHLDLVKASGAARQILPISLPWIPGHEFSGIVDQIGSDVAAYAPGDAVFGVSPMGGAYAEYLAIKPGAITRKPSNLSFEEAASGPVASQTAWQGIFAKSYSVWPCVSTKSGVALTNFIALAVQNLTVNWKTGFRPNVNSRLGSLAERIESGLTSDCDRPHTSTVKKISPAARLKLWRDARSSGLGTKNAPASHNPLGRISRHLGLLTQSSPNRLR